MGWALMVEGRVGARRSCSSLALWVWAYCSRPAPWFVQHRVRYRYNTHIRGDSPDSCTRLRYIVCRAGANTSLQVPFAAVLCKPGPQADRPSVHCSLLVHTAQVEAVVGMFQLLGLFGIVGLPGKS